MKTKPLTSAKNITELGELVRIRKISPLEIVSACLRRIEELNPTLNAFITVLDEQALKDARVAEAEIQAGNWRGPLHGVPVGIKDFFDTAGIRTTAGFEHFKDRVPNKDAIGVAKLKQAGAIIIGKTNMHQLGMGTTGMESYFGPVRNPWNPEYIPGGSSSGSAAAVASEMCYATLDTDAIGSCRLPAACCGVVGFKGTYGLISNRGVLDGEPADEMILWLAHAAISTRSVRDTALMLDALVERDEHTRSIDYSGCLGKNKELRIGVANNFKADLEVSTAFGRAVETIRQFGYSLSGAAVPFGNPKAGISAIETDRKNIAGQAFRDVDIILLPTTTATIPAIKDTGANPQALSADNTAFANYYGLPAISVPCGFDSNGLPIGLQIVAKPWNEGATLILADRYQNATEWSKKRPIQ
jgi:aspartyl-tRNA(Asn)/glutamyl-tRNA(Gln) amidotransferase subunit A